jgi:chromosomal replication initiator protein
MRFRPALFNEILEPGALTILKELGRTNTTTDRDFWVNCQIEFEKRLDGQTFATWFKPLRCERVDHSERQVYVRAPNHIVRDWVNSKYNHIIEQSFQGLHLDGYRVKWSINEQPSLVFESPREAGDPLAADAEAQPARRAEASLSSLLDRSEAKDLRQVPVEPPQDLFDSCLNPKYTFQTFVVGSCNQFAHAASLAVAEAPGKTYNPLYIYGGVGLGKTHLMQAAGHAIKQRNSKLRVLYISAERFMNELINAIRYDKTQMFREKYRSMDVLLIDDIQFMAGKERTQEEFFHTFNALYDGQKQIVITSDCPPREIPTLEERLHSRFEWGLIADMEPPDLETKVAILKRKADLDGFILPDDVALYIATKVKHNIRELEGSLIRLLAISSLRGLPISTLMAQDAVRNIAVDDETELITIRKIQQAVAAHYHLKVDQLTAKTNARQVSNPRQVAMYLCKQLTKSSFPEIGRQFGGKHHTTVMHSVDKVQRLVASDAEFQRSVAKLIETLGSETTNH